MENQNSKGHFHYLLDSLLIYSILYTALHTRPIFTKFVPDNRPDNPTIFNDPAIFLNLYFSSIYQPDIDANK
jgi:hypothetical protein